EGRRLEQLFPMLTAAQVARVAAHGHPRPIQRGDVLVEAGDLVVPFFVVTAGQIDVVKPSRTGERLVAVHRAGQFTGEVNMISGRRALMRSRVAETGEVIEVSRDRFLSLVQTDAELG